MISNAIGHVECAVANALALGHSSLLSTTTRWHNFPFGFFLPFTTI